MNNSHATRSPARLGMLQPGVVGLVIVTLCACGADETKDDAGAAWAISAGGGTTCALGGAGSVRCWGGGEHGQIGNAKTADMARPAAIVGLSKAKAIATGADHVCALIGGGKVRCWGRNHEGQLGDGEIKGSALPVDVAGVTGAVDIAAAGTSTCALVKAGGLRCWGGDLAASGDTFDDNAWLPEALAAVPALDRLVGGHCGVDTSGALWCWNSDHLDHAKAAIEVAGIEAARSAASSAGSHCAVDGSGRVWCWGANHFGQLGDGTTTTRTSAKAVKTLDYVRQIVGGAGWMCALNCDGRVWCWGRNNWGQLGDGSAVNRLEPVLVTGLDDVEAIVAGDHHACASRGDHVLCWGSNVDGRLGQGTFGQDPVRKPSRTVGIEFAKSISAGGSQACAIGGGKVWCWGHGDHVPVLRPELGGAVSVAAGEHHVCAVMDDGGVRCRGANKRGQLGSGALGGSQNAAGPVVKLGGAVGIAAGGEHSCAITGSGEVWCWGAGDAGQLGSADTADSPAPIQVAGISGAVALALGDGHSCALLGDGSVHCWGMDGSGELGRKPGSVKPGALVEVSGVPPAKAISASTHHTCAVSQAGDVWCWGFNGDGQLGGVAGTNRVPPGQVAGVSGAVQVTAGAWHACALLAGGKMSCWGDNTYGQLGNGTLEDSAIPTPVPELADMTSADAGGGHQCAIRADGSVWCWGLNVAGSVGDGSAFSGKPLKVVDL